MVAAHTDTQGIGVHFPDRHFGGLVGVRTDLEDEGVVDNRHVALGSSDRRGGIGAAGGELHRQALGGPRGRGQDVALAGEAGPADRAGDIHTGVIQRGRTKARAGRGCGDVRDDRRLGSRTKGVGVDPSRPPRRNLSGDTRLSGVVVDTGHDFGLGHARFQLNRDAVDRECLIRRECRSLRGARGDVGPFTDGRDSHGIGSRGSVGRRLQDRDIRIVGCARDSAAAIEQLLRAELRVVRDPVDRVEGVGDFRLVGGQSVGVIEPGVGRIDRQAAHLDEQGVDFVQGPFGGLDHRHRFVGVVDRLSQARNLSALLFGDDQGGGAVGTAVDFQAR